jgi:hypothetical protein
VPLISLRPWSVWCSWSRSCCSRWNRRSLCRGHPSVARRRVPSSPSRRPWCR